MSAFRRAAAGGASDPVPAVLRGVIVGVAAALFGVVTALSVVSLRVARKVVTPAVRQPDTKILAVDTAAQTITLSRTPDTALPGRYGLFTSGTLGYLKLGSVLSSDEQSVKRKLLTHIPDDASLAAEAAFSGWYYDDPRQLHLPFTPELVAGPLGPCPAWLFPAEEPTDVWAVLVHGRGTTRAECLRAVPVFRAAGITSLVVSYRNDGEAPRSRTGTYTLGATEWRDVDAAIGFAVRRGAKRVVIMGWSMGGAIALQVSLSSAHAGRIAGLVLESPVTDWRVVLDYQARQLRLPHAVSELAIRSLEHEWTAQAAGHGRAIPFEQLSAVSRAAELRHPILILHSDDDGFVPSEGSHELVAVRPDLVELQTFETARHTKLWNYDQLRWTGAISEWLARRGLRTRAGAEGS